MSYDITIEYYRSGIFWAGDKLPWLCVLHKTIKEEIIISHTEMFLICLQIHFQLLQCDAFFLSMLIIIFVSNLKMICSCLLKQRLEFNLITSPKACLYSFC